MFVAGPVDLKQFHTYPFPYTNPTTGEQKTAYGLSLRVVQEDGVPVDKPLNVISNRLIEQISMDLANGAYLGQDYAITASGPPPKTTYQVERRPFTLT